MTSRRFPGVELSEWRSRLIDRYSRLFPDAKPASDGDGPYLYSAGWPSVEDGWREVVEILCRRLDAVAERTGGAVTIYGISEKYAEIRVSVACEAASQDDCADVDRAVELAEARSSQTCGICGARGALWERYGWLVARCDQHGEGEQNTNPKNLIRISYRIESGLTLRIAKQYDYDRDTFVEIDHPSEIA